MRVQPYTKNYGQLKENFFFQKGAHQLVIQHQIINPEKIHTNNIIQTEEILLRKVYINVRNNNEKRGHGFERE